MFLDLLFWDVQIKGLSYFNLIKYDDPNTGEKKELRLLQDLSADWKNIGEILGFSPSEIEAIQNAGAGKTPDQCIRDVFSKWIQNADNKRYRSNWRGVHELLKDSRYGATANDLKAAIEAPYSDLHQSFEKSKNFIYIIWQ